ncbi:MAG TPA: hypothetical protein VNN79_01775 [Actinomycetota bacterium]|nr:hypothetical protein [Actinomycetota bacterium]
MRHRIITMIAAIATIAMLGLVATPASAAAPPAPYSNGFENAGDAISPPTSDTQAMFDVTRVTSLGNIAPASGTYFADAAYNNGSLSQFTRLGGYSSTFPTGGFTTSVDIYLDMSANPIVGTDLRFDWSSAISDPSGNHRRDFIFNVGTVPTVAGQFIMSASNNTPGWPSNPGRTPIHISTNGWYTFQNSFVDDGTGVLVDNMSVLDSSSTVLGTWTLSDPTDIIGTTVGGNRYGWLVVNQFPNLALDNITRSGTTPTPAVGTWSQYPAGGATQYQAAVQQPINTANTSNWSSKSKGAIPVPFKLLSKTGPAAFESIGSDASTVNDYAYARFAPSSPLTFSHIDTLKANFTYTLGESHGGSLRWQVNTASGNLHIYYGTYPNFTGTSGSGDNMVGLSDLRYDTSQFAGGTFYDTYAHALALMGNLPITSASLVIDSGWGGDQRLTVSNITVNDNVYQWNAGGTGDFTTTCDLPPATIEISKNDPVASGDVNEAPVQASLADDGNAFRVVDCKYQYILSIPSLNGKGTYEVQIWIDGVHVPTPGSPGGKVKFDIK